MSDVILMRLRDTLPLRHQVVSVEDKLTLDEMQTSLCTVVMVSYNTVMFAASATDYTQAITQRLEGEVKPQADSIMTILLQVLDTLNSKSSVADSVFAAIGALANALEDDFNKYMESFNPYLFKALSNKEEPDLCAMAIGLVSDITRSLGPLAQPYCNEFMNHLLENLRVCKISLVSSLRALIILRVPH